MKIRSIKYESPLLQGDIYFQYISSRHTRKIYIPRVSNLNEFAFKQHRSHILIQGWAAPASLRE